MSRRLLYLNGLAALCVVINHSIGWSYVAMFWWTDRYRLVSVPDFEQLAGGSYWALRLIEQLISFAIPAFLFVSGYFAAFASGKTQATANSRFVQGRLRYLIIPYLLWSVIMLLAELAEGKVYTVGEYARMLLLGQTTPAFYFVPLLVQLYLLSFVMIPIARRRWPLLLLGAGALQVAVQLMRYALILGLPLPGRGLLTLLTPGWFFAGSIFWFALGMVIGFHLPAFKLALARWRWFLAAAVVVFVPLGMIEWETLLRLSGEAWLTPKETLLDNLYALSFLLAFVAFDNVNYPASRPLADLGAKSFGIYLVHSLALMGAARAIYNLAPWLLAHQWLFMPVLIAVGLGVPLALMAIVKRSPAKRAYAYQFG